MRITNGVYNGKSQLDVSNEGHFSIQPEFEDIDQDEFFDNILTSNDLDELLLENSDDN